MHYPPGTNRTCTRGGWCRIAKARSIEHVQKAGSAYGRWDNNTCRTQAPRGLKQLRLALVCD
jgi:hypothetical protein